MLLHLHMTLGGGAEVCLPAAHIQASMETYMGLVEIGVGLIPGGGGNKELYIEALRESLTVSNLIFKRSPIKYLKRLPWRKYRLPVKKHERIVLFEPTDGISVNGDHLLYDAKQAVLGLDEKGYKPPVRRKFLWSVKQDMRRLLLGAKSMCLSGYISDHDLKIAKKLAYVIAGGKVPYGTEVDEQYLLDLEREAFLSLIAEPKSQHACSICL